MALLSKVIFVAASLAVSLAVAVPAATTPHGRAAQAQADDDDSSVSGSESTGSEDSTSGSEEITSKTIEAPTCASSAAGAGPCTNTGSRDLYLFSEQDALDAGCCYDCVALDDPVCALATKTCGCSK